jgi:hypothetical protein
MQIGDRVISSDEIYQLEDGFAMTNDETYITGTMKYKLILVLPKGIKGSITNIDQIEDRLTILFDNDFIFDVLNFDETSELDEFGIELLKVTNE